MGCHAMLSAVAQRSCPNGTGFSQKDVGCRPWLVCGKQIIARRRVVRRRADKDSKDGKATSSVSSGGSSSSSDKGQGLEEAASTIGNFVSEEKKPDLQEQGSGKLVETAATQPEGNALSRLLTPRSKRWTKIAAKGGARQLIVEPISSFSGISDYLALPIEEYSLLDPTWIEREEGEEDLFHFTIPLPGMGGSLSLEPQTWVKVDINTEKEEVRFSSSRIKLGDAQLDSMLEESLRFSFESRLSYSPQRHLRTLADVKEKAERVTRVPYIRDADGSIINVKASVASRGDLPAGVADIQAPGPDSISRGGGELLRSPVPATGREASLLAGAGNNGTQDSQKRPAPSGKESPATVEFGPTTVSLSLTSLLGLQAMATRPWA
mmetsp:Transcript_39395/g.111636  ORF Transcript_39395/g.111636 Transcript_39395/m.111636 type:complete len:379 (-) Transcript_39395:140-1276(-)